MLEVIWSGRGGQGAFTAAKLLGTAYCLRSVQNYALAFPAFGPERRGAPVLAFTRLDEKPIVNRSLVKRCDYLLCLDDTLYGETLLDSLKPGGKLILNTVQAINHPAVVKISASRIADEILHLPIVNTVMLGALSALYAGLDEAELLQAIDQMMPARLAQKNKALVLAAREGLR